MRDSFFRLADVGKIRRECLILPLREDASAAQSGHSVTWYRRSLSRLSREMRYFHSIEGLLTRWSHLYYFKKTKDQWYQAKPTSDDELRLARIRLLNTMGDAQQGKRRDLRANNLRGSIPALPITIGKHISINPRRLSGVFLFSYWDSFWTLLSWILWQ